MNKVNFDCIMLNIDCVMLNFDCKKHKLNHNKTFSIDCNASTTSIASVAKVDATEQ